MAAGHLDSTELFKPLNVDGPRPPTEQTQDLTDATEEDDPVTSEGPDNSPLEVSTGLLPQDVDMENLDLDPPESLAFVASNPKIQAPAQSFIVDIIGDPSLRPKKQIPIRSPSPESASSSGSEKIVFVPRRMRSGPIASRASSMKSQAASRIPSPRLHIPREQSPPTETVETVETTTSYITIDDPIPKFITTAITCDPEDIPKLPTDFSGRATQGNKRRRRRRRKKSSSDEDYIENVMGTIRAEAAGEDDYIENVMATMRAEAAEAAAAAHALETGESSAVLDDVDIAAPNDKTERHEPGAEDDWSSTDSDEAAEDSDAVNKYKAEQLWEEHDLADFDDISTSSESPKGTVDVVLRKRVRPSGTQYLVQWQGFGTDEATWVLAETLDSSADAKIEKYETTRSAANSDGDGDDDGDDEEQDLDRDLKLARLLQQQEALGITDSDLDLNIELDGFMKFSPAASARARKKKGGNKFLPEIVPNVATGFFPSASRFADAYDGFDPMDWERPSLARGKKQKKGKGKAIAPDLSDEELQETLRSSWMKDREKKKARNAEREVLRAEGLLGGGRHGKRDLKAKYKEGVTIEELQTEIREFLMGEHQRYYPISLLTNDRTNITSASLSPLWTNPRVKQCTRSPVPLGLNPSPLAPVGRASQHSTRPRAPPHLPTKTPSWSP